uniref:Pentatricopeptide repeat-containing protein n=1 Tax=Salix viminalis TaxID=40686 RepID=A0A6N2NJT4_SALVM
MAWRACCRVLACDFRAEAPRCIAAFYNDLFSIIASVTGQAGGRPGAASPRRGPDIHLPSSRQGAGSPSALVSMGVIPAAVPPASARNAEALLTCQARSAMVGDRVEGCSRHDAPWALGAGALGPEAGGARSAMPAPLAGQACQPSHGAGVPSPARAIRANPPRGPGVPATRAAGVPAPARTGLGQQGGAPARGPASPRAGRALSLFKLMPGRDSAAINLLIDGYVKVGDMGFARSLFDEMSERNVISWTSMIYGVLFDAMPGKNLVSWNAMIGGYCQNKQPHEALKLFRELQSSTMFEPNEIIVVSILPAIATLGALELGELVHLFVQRMKLDRAVNVCTSLVDMYAKCGEISKARKVFICLWILQRSCKSAESTKSDCQYGARGALSSPTAQRPRPGHWALGH